MKVRECHTVRVVAEDGSVSFIEEERWIETQDIENHDRRQIEEANDAIKAQLQAADLANLRALFDGDSARIAQHKASQAVLRARIKPVV